MTWNKKAVPALVLTVFIAAPPEQLLAQQSAIQTAFLAPTSIRLNTALPSIVESEHLPYLKQVARDKRLGPAIFKPNDSDLLIQQAEERFQNGRKFYQERDFDRARVEFDAAIDAMLKASENPTDRRLYESRLEDMVDAIHHDDLSGLGAAAQVDATAFDKAPLDDILQMTFPVDPRIKDRVRTEVRTTTSALPLVVNDAVLSYINYFNGRGHKTIEAGLARAGKYRPMISRILAEEGIPQELIHLAQAESGFLPRAVSRAAAEGMWQFVKFRGNEYGLKQTPYSDERLDPEKATRAAAHHLHDLYNEFGDWYLAIAAYNCGPGGVERAVERTGYADFWELRARGALPKETTAYVPIILAMTIMAKNAQAYGLDQVVPDEPVDYDTIRTTSPTNIALLSDLTDTSIPELMQLNPALLRKIAPGDFEIRVPKGLGEQVTAGLDLVPAGNRASWRLHKVQEGETLTAIAKSFNASAAQIASANSLEGSQPAAGDRLLIPAAFHEPTPVVRTAAKPRAKTTTARRTTPAAHTTVAAKAPAHRVTATVAQLKEPNRALNR
ncbi:MAG TPA: transglycosylase SLT domain-containing protein [Bryobacteraceae bacterium]|jgi:membrane-bound lytic murein transglycosylase D|nr:transglycosylase SLT domain-containing protein [Bryobacteraceae bacterium]